MQSRELWAAWILAALLVGLVAWAGHIQPRGDGLAPQGDAARRAPPRFVRPPGQPDGTPALHREEPSSGEPLRVYLCVIAGPLLGAC